MLGERVMNIKKYVMQVVKENYLESDLIWDGILCDVTCNLLPRRGEGGGITFLIKCLIRFLRNFSGIKVYSGNLVTYITS